MVHRGRLEFVVGIFMLLGMLALLTLALRVSGLSSMTQSNGYYVTAYFDNIGDLKVRAPVTISGVRVGQVSNIALDPQTFRAKVTLLIDSRFTDIPSDSSAYIFTQGLLGSNYISLNAGFENSDLKNGAQISDTHSALILENLIGQLLFKINGGSSNNTDAASQNS